MTKKNKHKGKILVTDDIHFSEDGYAKGNRRVVVTFEDGKNIGVNKIHTDKKRSFFKKKLKPNIMLPKDSVVDYKQHKTDLVTKKKLQITDNFFTYYGVDIPKDELKEIIRWARKVNEKVNKKKWAQSALSR